MLMSDWGGNLRAFLIDSVSQTGGFYPVDAPSSARCIRTIEHFGLRAVMLPDIGDSLDAGAQAA